MSDEFSFIGWWSEDEKVDAPKPWETFHVCLRGEEAGDIVNDPAQIREILEASGYEIIVKKRGHGRE